LRQKSTVCDEKERGHGFIMFHNEYSWRCKGTGDKVEGTMHPLVILDEIQKVEKES
jgi:hypothetical protein